MIPYPAFFYHRSSPSPHSHHFPPTDLWARFQILGVCQIIGLCVTTGDNLVGYRFLPGTDKHSNAHQTHTLSHPPTTLTIHINVYIYVYLMKDIPTHTHKHAQCTRMYALGLWLCSLANLLTHSSIPSSPSHEPRECYWVSNKYHEIQRLHFVYTYHPPSYLQLPGAGLRAFGDDGQRPRA